jgi:hypothetical protein
MLAARCYDNEFLEFYNTDLDTKTLRRCSIVESGLLSQLYTDFGQLESESPCVNQKYKHAL